MKIVQLIAAPDWNLIVISEDGRSGTFDLKPYLGFEAFQPLRDMNEFKKVMNGLYFIEWPCGADLSADTIEAHWTDVVHSSVNQAA